MPGPKSVIENKYHSFHTEVINNCFDATYELDLQENLKATSYGTVVVLLGIMVVWPFLPNNIYYQYWLSIAKPKKCLQSYVCVP